MTCTLPEVSPTSAVLQEVLHTVRQRLETDSRPPVVVFDLDSTLILTDHRNFRILRLFSQERLHGKPELQAALLPLIERLEAGGKLWNPAEVVRQAGVLPTAEERELAHFWEDHFFSSRHLPFDPPVPGAPAFVRACWDAGALCTYLTGRVEPWMKEGTLKSLAGLDFPLGERTRLLMKPAHSLPDAQFKAQGVEMVRGLGPVVALFENEPANLNLLHAAFPEAVAVFLETIHSPNAPAVTARATRIGNFL